MGYPPDFWAGGRLIRANPDTWRVVQRSGLVRSRDDGIVFDTPPQPGRRHIRDNTLSPLVIWRFNHQIQTLARGKTLRMETLVPSQLLWSDDQWRTVGKETARDTGLGVHVIDLSSEKLSSGEALQFTFYRPEAEKWEGKNFEIKVR